MSTSRSILAFAWSLVAALGAIGQNNPAEEKPTIERVRDLHLPYAAGAVPVYYSVGAEARALKYQKAIIGCQQWAVTSAPRYGAYHFPGLSTTVLLFVM